MVLDAPELIPGRDLNKWFFFQNEFINALKYYPQKLLNAFQSVRLLRKTNNFHYFFSERLDDY